MTNVQKFLGAILATFQSCENALQQLLLQRSVDDAAGNQLDLIGKLVGRARGGLDDDTYRRHIRAQIVANKSDGITQDLITIADLIVYDDDARYIVTNYGTGGVHVRVADIALTYELAKTLVPFLRQAASGGVRVVLEFSTLAPEDTFSCSEGPGPGYDTFAPGGGGGYATAIE